MKTHIHCQMLVTALSITSVCIQVLFPIPMPPPWVQATTRLQGQLHTCSPWLYSPSLCLGFKTFFSFVKPLIHSSCWFPPQSRTSAPYLSLPCTLCTESRFFGWDLKTFPLKTYKTIPCVIPPVFGPLLLMFLPLRLTYSLFSLPPKNNLSSTFSM